MSSTFTCKQLLYNAFLHAIKKKTVRKMTNFCGSTRFILFSRVWFPFFLILKNVLLHNWETGNEKRDFARDKNRPQKPLSKRVTVVLTWRGLGTEKTLNGWTGPKVGFLGWSVRSPTDLQEILNRPIGYNFQWSDSANVNPTSHFRSQNMHREVCR